MVKVWQDRMLDETTHDYNFVFAAEAVIDPYGEAHIIVDNDQLGLILEQVQDIHASVDGPVDNGTDVVRETSDTEEQTVRD